MLHSRRGLVHVIFRILQTLKDGCPSQRADEIHILQGFLFSSGLHHTWLEPAVTSHDFHPLPIGNPQESNLTDRKGVPQVLVRQDNESSFQSQNNTLVPLSSQDQSSCVLPDVLPPFFGRLDWSDPPDSSGRLEYDEWRFEVGLFQSRKDSQGRDASHSCFQS